MDLLLPTAFTLSPVLGWWLGAPWLTLARALLTWIGFGHYVLEHNRGHHRDQLYPMPESPQIPTGYAGMVLLALISGLFVAIMARRLPAPHNNTH